jgi:phage-related protein
MIQFEASGNDITSCLLENLTTGQNLTFTGTVTDGQTLKIDCEEITVLNNAVDQIGSFSGDFLKLAPGANVLKFTGSNCIIKVDWWDRWL